MNVLILENDRPIESSKLSVRKDKTKRNMAKEILQIKHKTWELDSGNIFVNDIIRIIGDNGIWAI